MAQKLRYSNGDVFAPFATWIKENGLGGYQPTCELRYNRKGVVEQKWIMSAMGYTHKWVKVRRQEKGEL